jgi:hypothetical protein
VDGRDIARCTATEIAAGWQAEENGRCRCLWCGEVFESGSAAGAHVAAAHDERERFDALLHADALLGLPAQIKAMVAMMFDGVEQKDAAERLGMSHEAYRKRRSELHQQEYLRSKLAAALFGIAFSRQPVRPYTKQAQEREDMPYFEADSAEPAGYAANKEGLHNMAGESWHATTLILPVRREASGALSILVCDKADRLADPFQTEPGAWGSRAAAGPRPGRYAPRSDAIYDCLGGHLERQDLDGGALTETAYLRCALRELAEELRMRGTSVEPPRLRRLDMVVFPEPGAPEFHREYALVNRERSQLYAYLLPEGVDARVYEEYADSLHMTVRKWYPVRYFSEAEIDSLLATPERLCDGLGRVALWLRRNPGRLRQAVE